MPGIVNLFSLIVDANVPEAPWQIEAPVVIGKLKNDNVLVEVTLEHGNVAFAVKVKVTTPLFKSATLGVYVQPVKESGFEKVPEPLEVH